LSRLKRVLQNTGLVIGSMVFVLVLLEMTVRVAGFGNLIIYQPDPKLMWKPLPNQDCYTKVGHKPIHVNSKGTRGKEFDEKKPAGVYRILSLGDSRTFGWGLSDEETYSHLLEKLLQDYLGNKAKVEVINAGVNAWSYGQIYVYLRDLGMKYNPDLVILADANLWTQFSEGQSKEFIKKMTRGVRLKNLLRRSAIYHYLIEVKLKKYYEKYRTKFIPVDPEKDQFFKEQQKSDPSLAFEEQIKMICELIKSKNVKGLIIFLPIEDLLISRKTHMIKDIKQKESEAYSIPLIDFTIDFSARKDLYFFSDDPVHPNVAGNRMIAQRIFDHIVKEGEFLLGN
jgi:lysophospholipase L1-like esterase